MIIIIKFIISFCRNHEPTVSYEQPVPLCFCSVSLRPPVVVVMTLMIMMLYGGKLSEHICGAQYSTLLSPIFAGITKGRNNFLFSYLKTRRRRKESLFYDWLRFRLSSRENVALLLLLLCSNFLFIFFQQNVSPGDMCADACYTKGP